MGTERTLFFFDAMFPDPESFGGQINDLASLRHCCWLGAQIRLTVLTAGDWINNDLIWLLHLLEVMPPMPCLTTWCFPAFLSQALWGTDKTIRRGRKTTIVAIFRSLSFQ